MPPFRTSAPLDGWSPILLASPHSGTHFPRAFLAQTRLPPATLRRLEDAHVGRLFARAADHAPLIEATHARAVIDLNRAESDVEPGLVAGRLAAEPSDRARAGFGLFPRIAAPGHPIYAGPIAPGEAEARLAALHRPWHAAISDGLGAARAAQGVALLLDCHSMPPLGPGRAQVVLGDRHRTSAAVLFVTMLEHAFRGHGLKVARNDPYAGGHTLERHALPAAGFHAIQIELCRSLYMNPETLQPHAGFVRLQGILADVVARLATSLTARGVPLAAE
jgi:N-formylglutamate deformylase